MADTQPPRVDNEIVQMWRRDGRLYAIAGFVAGVMVFPLLASLGGDRLTGFLQELVPELVGIGLTVFLIDRIIQRRDERNAEAALKRQLVIDVGSRSNEKAKDAVHQLWRKEWLHGEDGLLKDADLGEANLEEAFLPGVNLQQAYLAFANLQRAALWGANLQDARLGNAKLQRADLQKANLQGADFWNAYFANADLRGAKLEGANLRWADLQGAQLTAATFDQSTILPNGEFWTPETDMQRFTDPTSSDFFLPDW
jgi:hypothetical protein